MGASQVVTKRSCQKVFNLKKGGNDYAEKEFADQNAGTGKGIKR